MHYVRDSNNLKKKKKRYIKRSEGKIKSGHIEKDILCSSALVGQEWLLGPLV